MNHDNKKQDHYNPKTKGPALWC